MGALAGIFGLVAAVILVLVSLAGTLVGSLLSSGGLSNLILGGGTSIIIALIALILYTVFGFIFGCFYALVYNLIAKYVGGLEVETQ